MSIKIDPDTQKAVNPEAIGNTMTKCAAAAVVAVCIFVILYSLKDL